MTVLPDQSEATERPNKPLAADNSALLDEPRLIVEHGAEARIAALIAPDIRRLGYRLVRVRLIGQNGVTLQIIAERLNGMLTVGECEDISRAISPLLDVKKPVDGTYHLEISSPGIDRPLVRHSDFVRAEGHLIKLEMDIGIEGRRRFRGPLITVADNGITIEFEGPEGILEADLEFTDMLDARLVLTDALIDEKSLGRTKNTPNATDQANAGTNTGSGHNRRRSRQSAQRKTPKGSSHKGRARR